MNHITVDLIMESTTSFVLLPYLETALLLEAMERG